MGVLEKNRRKKNCNDVYTISYYFAIFLIMFA